jgi:hypothetical protein
MTSPTSVAVDTQKLGELLSDLNANSGAAFCRAYSEFEIAVRRIFKSEGESRVQQFAETIPVNFTAAYNHYHDICREAGITLPRAKSASVVSAAPVDLALAELPVVVSKGEPLPVAPEASAAAPNASPEVRSLKNEKVVINESPSAILDAWVAVCLSDATNIALYKLKNAPTPTIAQDVLTGLLAAQRINKRENVFFVEERRFCEALSQVADQIFPDLLRATASSISNQELRVISRIINGLSSSNFATFVSHAYGEDLEYSGKFMRAVLSYTELKDRATRLPIKLLMLAYKSSRLPDNGKFLSQAIITKSLAEGEQQNAASFMANLRELRTHPNLSAELKTKLSQDPPTPQVAARRRTISAQSGQLSQETLKVVKDFSLAQKPEYKNALIDRLRKEYLSTETIDGQTVSVGMRDLFQAIRTMAEDKKGLKVVMWIAMEKEPTLEQRHARLLLLSLAAREVISYHKIPATILRWGLEPDNLIVRPGHSETLMKILAPTNEAPTE